MNVIVSPPVAEKSGITVLKLFVINNVQRYLRTEHFQYDAKRCAVSLRHLQPSLYVDREHCILDRYCEFFVTSDNQFGFKKRSSCAHAIEKRC